MSTNLLILVRRLAMLWRTNAIRQQLALKLIHILWSVNRNQRAIRISNLLRPSSVYRAADGWNAARQPRKILAPSIILFRCSFAPKQSRHPERSASQIYRVTKGFMARSRRTPAVLHLLMLPEAFRPQKPDSRIC